jgi:endonuclease/exonuclease/phosphatase family metal-dependent hydrolase
VRIITYNLHKGQTAGKNLSFEALGHALAGRRPDLVFCQEVAHWSSGDHKQCDQLAQVLAHDHAFGPNAFYEAGCHGNATFAGHPIGVHSNHNVSLSRLEKRGILQTDVNVHGTSIVAFNVHFSLTARQRREQWHRLMALVRDVGDQPCIISGDFNDWTGELDREAQRRGLLEGALWALTRPEKRTFPARRPMLALDRVYFRGLRLKQVEVLRGAPWSRLSDHLPIEVEFESPAAT